MSKIVDLACVPSEVTDNDLLGLTVIEQLLTREILKHWPHIQATDSKTWTSQLLDVLKQLGRDQGFLVPPFRLGGNTHEEWLFDLVWMEGNSNPKDRNDKEKVLVKWEEIKTISRMVLACESELGGYEADLVADFMKLVYCNADFRLFLYLNRKVNKSGDGESEKLDSVTVCRDCCQTQMNQRYLLIGWPCESETGFRIDAWVV